MEHKISLSTPQALHLTLLVLLSIPDKLNHSSGAVLAEHGLTGSCSAPMEHPVLDGCCGSWRRMLSTLDACILPYSAEGRGVPGPWMQADVLLCDSISSV